MKLRTHNFLTWVPHLFLFYKEKVFRKLFPIMVVVAIYAILISWHFHNLSGYSLGQFHLIFSFILTIIISFRVNTSYARWWEGRTLWGGIVNNCRNLGLKFDVYLGLKKNPEFYGLLCKFPVIIKANLRKDKESLVHELQALGIDNYKGQPVLLIAKRLYAIINQLRNDEMLRFEQYMALDNHLVNLIDMAGGCERIANTPVPHAFAFFVKQALLFYTIIFPFGWANSFGFLVVPMMLMIVYVLLGLEMLSEELEEPFGKDENDLPLDLIAQTITCNLEQIAETQEAMRL